MVRLEATEARAKRNEKELAEVVRRQNDLDELVTSVAVMAAKQQSIERDVGEIKQDVKSLSGRAGHHWDGLIDKLIWAVCAAALSALLLLAGR